MGGKPLGLRLRLFGYRRSAVVALIEDRDRQLMEAGSRVRAAEARVADLEAEMASLRADNSRLEQHLELLRGQMVAIASRTQPLSHYLTSTPSVDQPLAAAVELAAPSEPTPRPIAPPTSPSASSAMVQELARVLNAAEEGAARIIHQAAVTAQEHIARSTKAWKELQAEASKVDAWRQAMGPVIGTVRSRLGDVRARIDEIPTRIQEALAPLAVAMSSIQQSLSDLSSLGRSLSLPEWVSVETASWGNQRESPNGQVEPDVIRVPESTPALVEGLDEASEHGAGWMRATVGY
jgi:uncharacterized membrane protein